MRLSSRNDLPLSVLKPRDIPFEEVAVKKLVLNEEVAKALRPLLSNSNGQRRRTKFPATPQSAVHAGGGT